MHISTIKSKQGNKVYHGTLLRRSYRDENGKSQKETVANLSALDDGAIEVLKAYYKGLKLVPADSKKPFESMSSLVHGPILALKEAFDALKIPQLIAARPSKSRSLICAMIAARILKPMSKLEMVSWWEETSLLETFSLEKGISSEELYQAMDWLLPRQDLIQKKLAARHLNEGCLALYDLSSSYYEGTKCDLAKHGYSRDKKKGKPQINYGLLCDEMGRPMSVSVYEGNINDHKTLMKEVDRLQKQFGISRVILVGDRGMMINTDLEKLKANPGIDWITALKKASVRKLARENYLNFSQGSDQNLCEIDNHPDFPEERLVACFNRDLQHHLHHKRRKLIETTEVLFEEIIQRIKAKRLDHNIDIALEVGSVKNRRRVCKYFEIKIEENTFSYQRKEELIKADELLDGVYVIRTSLLAHDKSAKQCVQAYKSLARVERAFRCLKTDGLCIRPIYHRIPDRVRAHVFLCVLSYYVEWHMRDAWRELTYGSPDLEEAILLRDPVASAKKSEKTLVKVHRKRTSDGYRFRKFRGLLWSLSTITKQRCRVRWMAKTEGLSDSSDKNSFEMVTGMGAQSSRALSLLRNIKITKE